MGQTVWKKLDDDYDIDVSQNAVNKKVHQLINYLKMQSMCL